MRPWSVPNRGGRQEGRAGSNRIRCLLTHFHPSLERVLGPRLDHQTVAWLLARYGSPTGPCATSRIRFPRSS